MVRFHPKTPAAEGRNPHRNDHQLSWLRSVQKSSGRKTWRRWWWQLEGANHHGFFQPRRLQRVSVLVEVCGGNFYVKIDQWSCKFLSKILKTHASEEKLRDISQYSQVFRVTLKCPQTLNAVTAGLNRKWKHQRCTRLYWGLQGWNDNEPVNASGRTEIRVGRRLFAREHLQSTNARNKKSIYRILMWSSSTHTSQLHVICKNLDIWNLKRSPILRISQSKKRFPR